MYFKVPFSNRIRPRIILVLLIFWVVLTGKFTLEYLLVGFILSFLITFFWAGFLLPPTPGKNIMIHPSLLYILIKYLADFLIDLIRANIQVALIVLNPRLPINPGFIEYDLKLEENIPRVLLANSITLTPGTLTIYLARKHIVVHALTKEAAIEVVDWKVEDYLKKLEGKG